MTPSFKSLKNVLCLASAIYCWAEDCAIDNNAISSAENPCLNIVTAGADPEVSRQMNLGFQNYMLCYPEMARFHFARALAADTDCLLAHVGMLLVHPEGTPAYREHLRMINQLINEVALTPVEEWYLSTFLQFAAGDIEGAAKAFQQRASRYKRDTTAACWDLMLSHYATGQGTNAAERADACTARQPEHAMLHFCRALLDEYASPPAAAAIESARKAAQLLPVSPPAHLLLGHLLALSGKHEESLPYFQEALKLAAADSQHIPTRDAATCRIAALSEICALWQCGNKRSALTLCAQLAKELPASPPAAGEGDILMHWETRTLPLRFLVLQPSTPSAAAIKAASSICNAPASDPLKLVQDCLVAAVQTRSLADSGRVSTATQTLSKAEDALHELNRLAFDMNKAGGITLSCYNRAVRACLGAVYRARLALYTDSASIWQPHLDELLAKPEPRFLPPVLPQFPKP